MTLAPGQRLGGYVVEERLGAGGMGEVWRGRDPTLGRAVAIKVVRADKTDARSRARFVVEGRAAAALVHPAVVTVFGAGEEDGLAYLAMELVDGTTLRQAMGAAPLGQRIVWLRRLAEALDAVHRAGFVHRDVKPGNVMVTRGGDLKLLDFGLVRPPPELGSLTQTGQVLGTPRYFAPEQLVGARVDARADQFAWGLVAYEALSGRHPDDVSVGFGRGPSWVAPAKALLAVAPEVPPAVASVVDRALAREPDERFRSMREIVDALGAALAQPGAPPAVLGGTTIVEPAPPRLPPPRKTTAPAVVFLAAMLVAVLSLTVAFAVLVARGDLFARARATSAPVAPSASTAPSPSSVAPPPTAEPPVPVASSAPVVSASAPARARPARPASPPVPQPSATSSTGRPAVCKAPFGSVDVDTSDFRSSFPDDARAAWQAAITEELTSCIRAAAAPLCANDTMHLWVVVHRGAHELGPISVFGSTGSPFADRSCLYTALGRALPSPLVAPAKGWVRLTAGP